MSGFLKRSDGKPAICRRPAKASARFRRPSPVMSPEREGIVARAAWALARPPVTSFVATEATGSTVLRMAALSWA